MARTERESEKRSGRIVGAAEASKELAQWRGHQRKNFNKLGLPKRKKWSQCHNQSSWQVRQSRFCQKEKEQRHRSTDREVGESLGEREPHLGEREREGSQQEHGEEKLDYIVKEGRFQERRGLAEHLDGLDMDDFCGFEKPRKRAYQKEKTAFKKQSKKGGQQKQVCGKGRNAGQSRNLGEVDNSKNRSRAPLACVKHIRND